MMLFRSGVFTLNADGTGMNLGGRGILAGKRKVMNGDGDTVGTGKLIHS